ncbi:MAG: hypothetical protein IPL61_18790 [Myxococcales bacterium]|nr:hypothetical protein [Myxococcales bacterium]
MRWPATVIALAAAAAPAAADLADVRLSEVATAAGSGDPAARYVELEATAAACVFPSTRVVSYDAAGAVLGDVAPFASATCLAAGSYLLLATPAAQAEFATGADGSLVPPLDLDAGQVCLVSSATRYDCVRWGAVAAPVRDLFGPDDASAAVPPPAGLALARIAATDVVAVDWRVESPTPRRPNDGSPWDPADAGVDGPRLDAGVDALVVDAQRLDAPADAAALDGNQRFLDLDPGGGAACGCTTGATPDGAAVLAVAAAMLARRRRRRGRG